MTSGLKGNHIVITLEASLKSELHNQLCFLLLPEHALPWNLIAKETFLLLTTLAHDFITAVQYGVGVVAGGRAECQENLTINRNSQKITCGRWQMIRDIETEGRPSVQQLERRKGALVKWIMKGIKSNSREVLTFSSYY